MNKLQVALAQISPVWLNKNKTLDKVKTAMLEAYKEKAQLIIFGEGLLPGYPFWLALTNGAQWDLKINKVLHAHYVQNSVDIENGDLDEVCALASQYKMAVYIGIIERASNRGGHSLYCSLVFINDQGVICSVHRKLQPTHDERLTWAPGDGNGLQVHSHKGFTLGGLNCWENWMPLPRAALYGMGENVHCAVWPGSEHNTKDITRFIARESRSYVISVSALMTKNDFPKDTPYFEELLDAAPDNLANGGSCVANPDGSWLIEPIVNSEGVFCAEIYLNRIYEERQNFDPSGHYSRPDVTQLHLNRERQSTLKVKE
ncbi:MAG: carbon-nitrogen hydrolase family protein [Flavobacteriaceae bacterium]|nr:carbon-nitrogen hydrolase family protein [Flavobacteriaceae bacterium]